MDDSQLERLLNSVGKGCFVRYFDRFSDCSLSNQEIAEILHDEMGYKFPASRSRASTARSIIRAGRALDAFEIVVNSNATPSIREQARKMVDSSSRGRQ